VRPICHAGATLDFVSDGASTAGLPEIVRRPSRLRALAELEANAESSAEALDRIASIACRVLDVPVVLVNLVGADVQRFVGCRASDRWPKAREMPITAGFCPFALGAEDVYALDDARSDPAHAVNPAVQQLGVVAYAGVPLRTAGGEPVGTLCAIDFEPRTWNEDELGMLSDLAAGVIAELQLLTATRLLARQRTGLQALTRLSQGLAGAETPDDVLRELRPAVDRFDPDAVRVLMTDGPALRTAAATDDDAEHADVALAASGAPAKVVHTGEPDFLATRADVRDGFEALLEDRPTVGAVALLPLTAGDSPIGALAICFDAERGFSAHDREYLTAVGGIAGLALAR
jgi:GAF domain-containing protein